MNTDHRYLGDAVYASFDGYQVWLHLNDHLTPPLIALEPAVLTALVLYYADMVEKYDGPKEE